MTNRKDKLSLDLTFCLGESFFDGQCLCKVERLLRQEAESWASELCIWRENEKPKRRNVKNFASDVQKAATERGALYNRLVKERGAGQHTRRTGSVELRGADDTLIVVMNLDDYIFAPSAGRWLWGNTITIQIRESRIDSSAAVDFARTFAVGACSDLVPWYAHGHLGEEWDWKNISREGGGMMAKGVDASRYLPGLYWLNFFGKPYHSLIGMERVLTAPAHAVKEMKAGALLYVSSTPECWDTPDYRATEAAVLKHLGEQYFFSSRDPDRPTVAPDFALEPLQRNLRFT